MFVFYYKIIIFKSKNQFNTFYFRCIKTNLINILTYIYINVLKHCSIFIVIVPMSRE